MPVSALVRETLNALPSWHHVKSYLGSAQDLLYDAGLVDTFLHPSDRAYSVRQVLQFARDNGLQFQDWLDRQWYSIAGLIPAELGLRAPAARLDLEDQWQLTELLGQAQGSHRFLLCHPERDPRDYKLEFSAQDDGAPWLGYVPHLRPAFASFPPAVMAPAAPTTYRRDQHEFTLAGQEARLFALVDGAATIGEIIERCAADREVARGLFARMHEWDHLLYQVP